MKAIINGKEMECTYKSQDIEDGVLRGVVVTVEGIRGNIWVPVEHLIIENNILVREVLRTSITITILTETMQIEDIAMYKLYTNKKGNYIRRKGQSIYVKY